MFRPSLLASIRHTCPTDNAPTLLSKSISTTSHQSKTVSFSHHTRETISSPTFSSLYSLRTRISHPFDSISEERASPRCLCTRRRPTKRPRTIVTASSVSSRYRPRPSRAFGSVFSLFLAARFLLLSCSHTVRNCASSSFDEKRGFLISLSSLSFAFSALFSSSL